MCQTVAQGGRRCAGAATRAARRALSRAVDKAAAAGDRAGALAAADRLVRFDQALARYGNTVTPMDLPVPASVTGVFDVIRGAGFRPLVVGGSVRDALTDGRTPKDIDVEVYGASVDEVAMTLRSQYRVDEVGRAFGVLKVTLPDGTDLDVSVPRRDNHVGAGHRGFEVEMDRSMTVAEAAARRDFTVNAMSFDPEYGVCVDPYGGRADLDGKVLRHTGAQFAEDPLRVLRGFQFASRYGMTMDDGTVRLCRSLVGRAGELPIERVRGEWGKFYAKGSHPVNALAVLADTGWDATVPGLVDVNTPRVRAQAERAVQVATGNRVSTEERAALVAATIVRGMPDATARTFLNRTVEGGDAQRAAYGLSRAVNPSGTDDTSVRRWAHTLRAGRTSVRAWARMAEATGEHPNGASLLAAAERLGCADGAQPDLIQGRDVLPRFAGRPPGPWVGEIVAAGREAQKRGEFTDAHGGAAWLTAYQEATNSKTPRP